MKLELNINMQQQQIDEVKKNTILIDAIQKAESGGLPNDIIHSAIAESLDGVKNTATREAAKMAAACILAKLKTYEAKHTPTTWFGRFFKKIFG